MSDAGIRVPASPVVADAAALRVVRAYFLAGTAAFVIFALYLALSWADVRGHHFQPRLLALTHIATLGWISTVMYGAMFFVVPRVLGPALRHPRLAAAQLWVHLMGTAALVSAFWLFELGPLMTFGAALVALGGLLFLANMASTLARVTRWTLTGYFIAAGLLYFFITIALGFTLALNLSYSFISRSHLDLLGIHAHFGLIGWMTMVVMGVALTLLPRQAGVEVRSTRLAWWAFALVNVGLLGSMAELTLGKTLALYPLYLACIVGGIGTYVAQIATILRGRARPRLDQAMRHAAVAFASLVAASALGVAVALGDATPAHERLVLVYGLFALVGYASSMIVGQMTAIAPRLVRLERPSSSVKPGPRLARVEFWLFLSGLLIAAAGLGTGDERLFGAGAALLAAGALTFGAIILRVFASPA